MNSQIEKYSKNKIFVKNIKLQDRIDTIIIDIRRRSRLQKLNNSFRREITSAIFVQIFSVFSSSIFGAYYVIVLDDLKVTAIIIGYVLTIRNLVQIFLRVPFSELSQIIGRKPLIITGNLCYTIVLGMEVDVGVKY